MLYILSMLPIPVNQNILVFLINSFSQANLIQSKNIIIDAKSGVSGAGRMD